MQRLDAGHIHARSAPAPTLFHQHNGVSGSCVCGGSFMVADVVYHVFPHCGECIYSYDTRWASL